MVELQGSGAEPLEAGDPHRIGPIPLAGRLGAGGMGRVYLGVHEGRYVAVKQLLASVVGEDEDFLRRFGHELDNISRLPPRATAPLIAGDRTARPPWFATAYVPGLTLREALEVHGGPLPVPALWLLLREVAAGLASVHELDMVHRDLKPSNIMLTLDGLTLIDFGIARAAEQSQLTRTGMVVGTPAYMAPEQASGSRRLSGATDVFALGSVLAYAACGQPPFGDESGHGVLYRIVHEEPGLGPLRELEPDLAEVVAACLDKDPEGRPTAAELLERATRQGSSTTPLWPQAVTGRLAERAAFAAEVQAVDTPTVPLTEGSPEPEAEPEPKQEREPGAKSRPGRLERPERRRNRVFVLPVLAVVVVGGTTLAIQHLPYASPPRAEAQATPSAPAPAPDGSSPPGASGTPSGAVSPGASPAGGKPGSDAGKQGQPGVVGSQGAGTGGTGAQDGTDGSAASGTSGGAAASGGSGTSGTSSTSGASNGSGTSGSSGGTSGSGSVTPAPAPPPASGTYRYRNGDNGACITQVYGAADHQDCADSTARWTVRSGSDGSFKLVNQQTGQCLYSNGLGQAVFVGDCAQGAGRLWRAGAGGSLRSDYGGGCLDLGMSSGLVTKTCAGEASQRWTKQA
ncbi:serine/threonine-protein kinase [Streptomyces sp. NRRL S-118]|uniref:serine/threonine-protein kinase n=1 Tax=Streptomyces sp. NRRL S-118 TaxID=1463881 RepID=UPI0004C90E23|nr:serine/threonine-protein kinase [Streptomyces sp. NRRL S-118]